jgi:hypothetical protein
MRPRAQDFRRRRLSARSEKLLRLGAIAAACGLVCGCATTAVPPGLTDGQRATLHATKCLDVTVGVERYRFPAYSDKLIVALRGTGVFAAVEDIGALDAPTFVARVERPIYGSAVIPWLTALTVGLIATTVEEEHGYSFSLTPSSAPTEHIPIEFSYHGPSTLGWRAVLINVGRKGTATDVYRHPRMLENVAWAIVEHEARLCPYTTACCHLSHRQSTRPD